MVPADDGQTHPKAAAGKGSRASQCHSNVLFANNDVSGAAMAVTLIAALPRMLLLARTETPPFIASINKSGEVKLRENL